MTNHEDILEDIQQNIHEDSQMENCKVEYEKCFSKNRKTTELDVSQDHYAQVKKIIVFFHNHKQN